MTWVFEQYYVMPKYWLLSILSKNHTINTTQTNIGTKVMLSFKTTLPIYKPTSLSELTCQTRKLVISKGKVFGQPIPRTFKNSSKKNKKLLYCNWNLTFKNSIDLFTNIEKNAKVQS